MAGRPVMCVALRGNTVEWATVETPTCQQAVLELSAEHPALLDAARADRERLVQELRARGPRAAGRVVLGIPAGWTLMRIVELPAGAPEEVRSMVDLQVEKFSPFPPETTVVSYEQLQATEGRLRVLIVALQNETVDAVGAAFRAAGLHVKWVDLNLLGWWRLLADEGHVRQSGAQALLVLDGPTCDLIVAHGGQPVAMRSLLGLEALSADEFAEEVARETAYTLAALNLEQGREHVPVEVTIWHRGPPPEELLKRFRDQFGLSAQARILDDLPPLSVGLCRRAAGRGPGTLDLALPAWQEAEAQQRLRYRMLGITAVLLGIWLAALVVLIGGLQLQKRELQALETRLAALQGPAERVRNTRSRVQLLEQYVNRTHSALECLREVSDLLPPGIELRSFTYRKGRTVELAGEAEAVSLVYDFKKELEKSDLFKATELHRTVRSPQGKENFRITAVLPGGTEP